jgi:hypothetical protein
MYGKERIGERQDGAMNHLRGMLMLLAAIFAFYRGWKIHSGEYAWMAYGLGVAALALAAWHLTRTPDRRA